MGRAALLLCGLQSVHALALTAAAGTQQLTLEGALVGGGPEGTALLLTLTGAGVASNVNASGCRWKRRASGS